MLMIAGAVVPEVLMSCYRAGLWRLKGEHRRGCRGHSCQGICRGDAGRLCVYDSERRSCGTELDFHGPAVEGQDTCARDQAPLETGDFVREMSAISWQSILFESCDVAKDLALGKHRCCIRDAGWPDSMQTVLQACRSNLLSIGIHCAGVLQHVYRNAAALGPHDVLSGHAAERTDASSRRR